MTQGMDGVTAGWAGGVGGGPGPKETFVAG